MDNNRTDKMIKALEALNEVAPVAKRGLLTILKDKMRIEGAADEVISSIYEDIEEVSPSLSLFLRMTDKTLCENTYRTSKPFVRYCAKVEKDLVKEINSCVTDIGKLNGATRESVMFCFGEAVYVLDALEMGGETISAIAKIYLARTFFGRGFNHDVIGKKEPVDEFIYADGPASGATEAIRTLSAIDLSPLTKHTQAFLLSVEGRDRAAFYGQLVKNEIFNDGYERYAQNAWEDVCARKIAETLAKDRTLTRDTIHIHGLPSKEEQISMFSEFLLRCAFFIAMECVDPLYHMILKCGKDIIGEGIEEHIYNLEDKIGVLKNQLEEAEKRVATPENVQGDEKQECRVRELEKENKELRHKIAKLEREAQRQQEEKKIEEDILAEFGQAEAEDYAYDQNSRILFIANDEEHPSTISQIESTFPNAVITNDVNVMRGGDYDLAVFLIKYITKHSYYWRAKDVVKQARVPFMHSRSANASRILREIQTQKAYRCAEVA